LDRPSFDDIYMHMALMMAHRSTCSRAQVGCIITTIDNQRVLSVGYNGGPKGLWNECQSDEPGKCGHLHAEDMGLRTLTAPSLYECRG
jgi:dCMP deaminase